MAQMRIDFQWRGEVQTFSWARIQAMGNGVQLTLGVAREGRAFGQVLTQQSIRVFIRAALPRAVGISKEHLNLELLRQALLLGHLFASIIGQGVAQRDGHLPELLGEATIGALRIRALHFCQQNQAGRPLDQCADCRSVARPLEEVAFPVAWHGVDGRRRGNRRPTRARERPGKTVVTDLLVTIHDLNLIAISTLPSKTDPILIVDPTTVPCASIRSQPFDAIAWWCSELDLNPIFALPPGQGCKSVDVRIRIEPL